MDRAHEVEGLCIGQKWVSPVGRDRAHEGEGLCDGQKWVGPAGQPIRDGVYFMLLLERTAYTFRLATHHTYENGLKANGKKCNNSIEVSIHSLQRNDLYT